MKASFTKDVRKKSNEQTNHLYTNIKKGRKKILQKMSILNKERLRKITKKLNAIVVGKEKHCLISIMNTALEQNAYHPENHFEQRCSQTNKQMYR